MFNNSELIEHNDRLRNFAYKLTFNAHDADDLLQSTILRAIEKKHLFKEGTNLYSWVSKIMYNLFVSGYRRRVKFETQYDPENYLERESVESNQEKIIEFKEVQEAIDTLSSDHKDVLVMICIKSMKYADVAKTLSIPVGTVRSRLSRAREKLQEALDTPIPVPAYIAEQSPEYAAA